MRALKEGWGRDEVPKWRGGVEREEQISSSQVLRVRSTHCRELLKLTGIYIMQITMVRGGDGQLGEKKLGVQRKKEENYSQKGEMALKINFFGP